MFIFEFCNIFKNIFRQNTSSDCICEFWKAFQITTFIVHLWETAYFMHKLQDFDHQIQPKSISQVPFKHFIQEQEVAIRRPLFT